MHETIHTNKYMIYCKIRKSLIHRLPTWNRHILDVADITLCQSANCKRLSYPGTIVYQPNITKHFKNQLKRAWLISPTRYGSYWKSITTFMYQTQTINIYTSNGSNVKHFRKYTTLYKSKYANSSIDTTCMTICHRKNSFQFDRTSIIQ